MLPHRYGRRVSLQVPSKFMCLPNYTASHPRDDNHHSQRSEDADLAYTTYRLQQTKEVFAPCHLHGATTLLDVGFKLRLGLWIAKTAYLS